ncbi:alpha-hydroxy-acid oxidizing protein [Desulfofundulus kuznetsovii]|uniref:alpha-hydroxy-acid oxidizing protein n=1 Tax=Desulfofundulus kuznetsovii TaxID=58135 RepID=UPI0003111034
MAHKSTEVNRTLARFAYKYGLTMAVGSLSAFFHDPGCRESFYVAREENPNGIILATVSCGTPVGLVREGVSILEASAVQVHLNTAQELIMPEGRRRFFGIVEYISMLQEAISVPVIAKEVGFGIPREACLRLLEAEVSVIDVGGRGGTNFALIEHLRRRDDFAACFASWGIPTAVSLLECLDVARQSGRPVDVIASGGVASGLDCLKLLSLGAHAVGVAGHFLLPQKAGFMSPNGVREVCQQVPGGIFWKAASFLNLPLTRLLSSRTISPCQRSPETVRHHTGCSRCSSRTRALKNTENNPLPCLGVGFRPCSLVRCGSLGHGLHDASRPPPPRSSSLLPHHPVAAAGLAARSRAMSSRFSTRNVSKTWMRTRPAPR